MRPSATQAAVAGPTVTVIWSEALDESSVPTGAGGFVVRIGNTHGPAVNAVAVSGSTTTLSLASAIADGTADVTVEYTPPGSGAKIRDAAGNDAAAILRADALDVTVTPDTRAPEVSGMPTVDGATLKVTFDEALDTSSVPAAPGGFTVTVTRGGSAVSGHTVSTLSLSSDGTVLTLTLALAVRGGDEVKLAYEPPGTNPLQDRATTPNPVAGFTSADAKDVENSTPSVKGLPVFAGGAATYAIGEVIAVEVTFTEAVSATTTSSARPEVAIEIGTNTRKARYVSGSGSVKLRFEYAVAEGDADTDGIAIAANALAAPTGSAIRTTTGNRAVQLAHDGVAADAERTVDGVRPTTTAAVAEGLTIEVTWSEALDPALARSDAGGFRVKIGTGNGPAVTAVAVDGTDATKLRLTLADRIADGTQNATLEYRPPSSGAKIRDAAGNDAEGFTGSDAVAVSVTPDTTAPMLAAAAVDGARLTLTFDEPLDEASVPAAPGGFTVTVTRDGNAVPGHTVSGIAVSGATVTLTLAKGVLPGDTVTLDYVPTTTPLQDRAATPNPVAGFTGVDMKMVDNASDALEVSLSTTEALEGDDRTVTLTVAVAGGGTSGVARVIAITPETAPTAAESEDWTLPAGERTLTLGAGERSAAATIAVVDDARLEIEETVSFAVTADGAAIGQVTLTIADDDRAVLEVSGPDGPVTEGQPIELTLRLEPHPENVANVAAVPDDACIVDFPVTATLTRSGDTGALPSNATLETEHTFAAAAFDDCTREVTVSVPTKASDGVWMVDRALSFALSPQAGSDPRVEGGEALQATVRDDTPKPGPVVTQIELSPVPPEATADHSGPYRKEDFLALPDAAVHGFGAQLMFTITFDIDVTVTLGVTTGGVPELVLDIFGRERRARYTGAGGSGLRTMAFAWTVEQGDYDPNGLAVTGLVVNGATIRDTQDRDTSPETFPAKHFKAHRVRGGLFAMSLDVEGPAEEGEPIEIRVVREGGTEQAVGALIEITDSGMEDRRPEDVPQDQPIEIDGVRLVGVFFEAEDNTRDIDPSFVTYRMIPPGDGKTNATRTLTFELVATDIRDGDGPKSWYNVGNGEATISVLESGTGTGGPGLSVGPADAFEEPGAVLAFEVSLDATSSNDVSVDYATRDGTADEGEDYTTTSGTLTFAPGDTVRTVEVPVHTDSNMEDIETVWLDLSNPLGAVIVTGSNYGQIHNITPVEPPRVQGGPRVSPPDPNGAWMEGKTVEVIVTFNEAVEVKTNGGTPTIGIKLDTSRTREAPYARGSDTHEIVFAYTIANGDGNTNRIEVNRNSMKRNGAEVHSAQTKVEALLDHDGTVVQGTPGSTAQGPSARFERVPEHHEGTQFNIELHFNTEIPGLSYQTVQGGLLEVEGGTVSAAARLTAGSNQGWRVSVTPSRRGQIEIRLPVRECGEPNAVCIDNQPLTEAVSATVQGVPLTAQFRNVPEEHDGETPFEIEFVLSEEPAGLSYRTVQGDLFDVNGGHLVRAWRLEKGNDTGWGLKVEPVGFEDVSLEVRATTHCDALPGVCTADGRMLAGGLHTSIKGPATLSVSDAETDEEAGGTLDFVVSLSRALEETVTVEYRTEDGTAQAPADYTRTSGTLTFALGERSKIVPVPMLDDGHDEGSETMKLKLENPSPSRVKLKDDEGIGTINNHDPMPKAWMVRFGRTVGSQLVDALNARLEGAGGSHVTVAGINVIGASGLEPEAEDDDPFGLPEWAKDRRLEADERTITADDLLLGSAFHLSSGGDGTQGGGPAFTAWGRVATGAFEAEEDGVTMDGEVTTALIGFDAEWERALAGVMLSQSTGDGSYQLDPAHGSDAGTVESSLTGVYPYARIDLNAQVSAWALAGAGSGELTLHQEGGKTMPTDISMRMGALGVKGQVLDGTGASGLGVNVKSDAMWVGTKSERTNEMVASEGNVTRLRLIIEGERVFVAGNGATFTPSAEVGLRHDGGDAETGTGIEVGAGLRYTIGAVTIEAQARTLIAHEASGYEEWGLSAAIRVTPSPSGRGLTLSIALRGGRRGAPPSNSGPRTTQGRSGAIRSSKRRAGWRWTQATGSGSAPDEACSPPMRA